MRPKKFVCPKQQMILYSNVKVYLFSFLYFASLNYHYSYFCDLVCFPYSNNLSFIRTYNLLECSIFLLVYLINSSLLSAILCIRIDLHFLSFDLSFFFKLVFLSHSCFEPSNVSVYKPESRSSKLSKSPCSSLSLRIFNN